MELFFRHLGTSGEFRLVSRRALLIAVEEVVFAAGSITPLEPLDSVADPTPQVVQFAVDPPKFLQDVVVKDNRQQPHEDADLSVV